MRIFHLFIFGVKSYKMFNCIIFYNVNSYLYKSAVYIHGLSELTKSENRGSDVDMKMTSLLATDLIDLQFDFYD